MMTYWERVQNWISFATMYILNEYYRRHFGPLVSEHMGYAWDMKVSSFEQITDFWHNVHLLIILSDAHGWVLTKRKIVVYCSHKTFWRKMPSSKKKCLEEGNYNNSYHRCATVAFIQSYQHMPMVYVGVDTSYILEAEHMSPTNRTAIAAQQKKNHNSGLRNRPRENRWSNKEDLRYSLLSGCKPYDTSGRQYKYHNKNEKL